MPDERQDSIRRGIHSPAESPTGSAAEEERQRRVAGDPPIDSAMGGSSDADRPADEAQSNAARAFPSGDEPEPRDGADQDARRERSRTVRETREAGVRSQGGGSADEREIERAAREDDLRS